MSRRAIPGWKTVAERALLVERKGISAPALNNTPPPESLSVVGAAEWKRLLATDQEGALLALDYGIVETYCHAFERVAELRRLLKKEGAVIKDVNIIFANPRVAMLERAEAHLNDIRSLLRLTPLGRAKFVQRTWDPTKPKPDAQKETTQPSADGYSAGF